MKTKPQSKLPSEIEITVLVTAHNEVGRIQPCLRAIVNQDYPMERVEILLVDDRSTDATVARALALELPNLRVLRLGEAPPGLTSREAALDLGLREARGEIVLVTDAGGRVPREWIRELIGHLGFRDGAVTGPVVFAGGHPILSRFQSIDTLLLLTLNRWAYRHNRPSGLLGANMGIRREAYLETGGFPAIGLALGEDHALGQALMRGGWTLRYLTGPATTKTAERNLAGYLERARRRALNLTSSVWWASFFMVVSNLALAFMAMVSFSTFWPFLLMVRYVLGVILIGVWVSQYGASDLIFWTLLYEPVMTLTGVFTFFSNLFVRRWSWGGVQYDHTRGQVPATPAKGD
jgi:cellulose synthase/poly-beta-1,6-N-acetylglucosamine synthase-like glycosyltransferase